MFWLLLFVAICAWSIYYRWERRRIYKVYNELPKLGFKAYPVVGHAYLFGRNSEERMNFFKNMGEATIEADGIVTLWMANRLYVSVCDPVIAEVILKQCLDKDDTTMRILRSFTGNGSIFASVKIWRPRRKVLVPVFSMKNLQGFMGSFVKKATIMTKLLEQHVGKGEVPLWNYLNTYSFDSISKNSLGIELNSQKDMYHPFLQAFEQTARIIAFRVVSPWLYWDPIFWLSPWSNELDHWKQMAHDVIDDLIRLKREELAALKSTNDSVRKKSFLDMLIESSGKEDGYTDIELREEIEVIIVGGSDTSSVAIGYTAVLLSRYPEVQEKVYQELEDVFGNSDRPITVEDLPKLVYLEAVVKETLRLYPPAPVFVREVIRDCKLPNGATLVNGVGVIINVHGMHRNPKYWGEDAEQFRPERFLEGPLRHPVQYIPFSYSKRNCPGGTYAMMSIKTALATMLRRYRLLPPASLDPQQIKQPLRVKFDILMRHVNNYSIRLEYRNN